jgi:hypothetical protein
VVHEGSYPDAVENSLYVWTHANMIYTSYLQNRACPVKGCFHDQCVAYKHTKRAQDCHTAPFRLHFGEEYALRARRVCASSEGRALWKKLVVRALSVNGVPKDCVLLGWVVHCLPPLPQEISAIDP